jgi:hypothetical protein
MYHILSHSPDTECAANLQEVLKMSISILRGPAAKWALLHLVDVSWFKFKIAISDVVSRPVLMLALNGAEKSLMHFRAAISASLCGGGDP